MRYRYGRRSVQPLVNHFIQLAGLLELRQRLVEYGHQFAALGEGHAVFVGTRVLEREILEHMIMDFLFVQIMDIAINSNTLYRKIGFKTKYRKMPSLFYQLWSFTKPPYLINWEWRIGMPIRA